MTDFEIIGVPNQDYRERYFEASARRGFMEFWLFIVRGDRVARVANYHHFNDATPDEHEFYFGGNLGRFAVTGMVDILKQKGRLHVEARKRDMAELMAMLSDIPLDTPDEAFFPPKPTATHQPEGEY